MVVQLFEGTRVVRNLVEQLAGKNAIIVSVALPFLLPDAVQLR